MTAEDEWILGKYLILYPMGMYLAGMLGLYAIKNACRKLTGKQQGWLA